MKLTIWIGMAIFLAVLGCIQPPDSLGNVDGGGADVSVPLVTNDSFISPYRFRQLLDDDFRFGSDSAPIVIVEFADFQCPISRQWWTEEFPRLENEFIQTGKVQFIYRDYPLVIHPSAQLAAEAAECAGAQGKWREMHDKLFDAQNRISKNTVSFHRTEIEEWAGQVEGLDVSFFQACLDNGTYQQEVWDDYSDASYIGVDRTPTFVIGKRNGAGEILWGAYDYAYLREKIEALLAN